MNVDTIGWRTHFFEEKEVLEIARRFESVSYPPGIYRIGMNLDEFHELSRGYDRQIIAIAVILFLLTVLVVAVVSTNQNYFILDRTFRQMRSMTETIFDRLSSAVLAYDADGKVIAVNKAFAVLTGIDAGCIGQPVADLTGDLQFDLPEKTEPGEMVIGTEKKINTPSGDQKIILLGISSLPPDAGGGVVVLVHDITDQKRLEEESRRRDRLSEMGDMAAGVAHEIRNPLNAIGIAAQRLKMEFEPKDEHHDYDSLTKNILDETARLNQILTRFLELAKTRAAEDKPVDLADAINKSISSLTDEATKSNVTLNYPAHDKVNILGSIDKMQQVFINLIKNSIQAMPDGGSITLAVEPNVDKKAVVTLSDTGPGFPDEVMTKIFQPYFTTKADGSGLGLALAYKTITDYGGTIEASNAPDGGAQLQVTLPMA
jgi:PAS domain S-box-containing protein